MKFPQKLSPGDKVSIISPAGKINRQLAERGAELLRQQGFRVVVGQHAFDEEGIFAGSDFDLRSISFFQRKKECFDLKKAF